MFEIDSYVIYGMQGACRICEKRRENFTGEEKDYYILSPVDDPKMVIYVPVDSQALTSQMRPLMSREEIDRLISEACVAGTLDWINDPRSRNEHFRTILQSGDRYNLFRLLRTIHLRRAEQEAQGRKLYAADELVYEKAERLLHGEIALILRIRPEEVRDYIRARLPAEG